MRALTLEKKEAEREFKKWDTIVKKGSWGDIGKTERYAVRMRDFKEGFWTAMIIANNVVDAKGEE
jgi:hypothetical protein